MTINVFASFDQTNSWHVMRAFALGLGLNRKFAKDGGDVLWMDDAWAPPLPPEGPIAVHGYLRGGGKIVKQAIAEGRDWYFGDNGYMKPSKKKLFDGYYRITRNAYQLNEWGQGLAPDFERFAALDIEIRPWRASGTHVLICPPIPLYCKVRDFNGDAWVDQCRRKLAKLTDRPVRVRLKPVDDPRLKPENAKPLSEDLKDCWAVVVHDSNVAVECVAAGVPVFALGPSPARALGNMDLAGIEFPTLAHNREEWLAWLAANQWRIDELKAGRCARDLGLKIRQQAAA